MVCAMQRSGASEAMKQHRREYLMEASGLGVFMLSACAFVTLIVHPAFPVVHAVGDPHLRRFLIGKRIALVDRDVRGTPDAERKESRWRSVAPLPGQRRDVLV